MIFVGHNCHSHLLKSDKNIEIYKNSRQMLRGDQRLAKDVQ